MFTYNAAVIAAWQCLDHTPTYLTMKCFFLKYYRALSRLPVVILKFLLRGFDPLLLCFLNEIKIVSYSFSSSVIEYNSNEKLLKA